MKDVYVVEAARTGVAKAGKQGDRVNQWGSGISIGHPLACTGARIACDITAMFSDPDYSDVEYIVESMCIGHGQGAAAIWQKVIN